MMNRQLRIWKEDFLRYYKATSVLMRIMIGAVLSFAISYILIHKVVKVQNTELKKLKQSLQSLEVIDDAEIQKADLKNKQRKTSMILEGLKKANKDLMSQRGTFSKGDVGKHILDLRFLLDSNHLRIVSEERIMAVKKPLPRRGVKKAVDTRIKIQFPSSMAVESYKFSLLGSYSDLRKFFTEIRNSEHLFFVNNIHMVRSKEMLTDKNLNQYRALSCTFEVHVPYLNAAAKSGGKK